MHRNCGRCHACGSRLQTVLDGEEHCARCQAYRRYISHGWHYQAADRDERARECPRKEGE